MSELKPCPFCGGEAELRDDGEAGYPYYVQCVECGCMTCGHLHADGPFGAIDAWNARAERTCRNIAADDSRDEFVCSECGYVVGAYEYGPDIGEHCKVYGAKVER